MTDKIERRRRLGELNRILGGHARRDLIALGLVLAGLIILMALTACGPSRSTVSPSAKASARATASQIARGIKTGQAAKQAEGIVQGCFRHYSGTGLIRCILPYAHHKALFRTCAYHAFGADIPGKEVTFVNTALPGCLVAAR